MIEKDFYYKRIGRIYQECTEWRNSALDEIDSIKPDITIVGNSAYYEFTEEDWVNGSEIILSRLSQSSKEVIVIPGAPALTFDGPNCLARNSKDQKLLKDHNCHINEESKEVETLLKSLQNVTSKYNNVKLLNLNNLVCPNQKCSAITDDGVVVYLSLIHI